MIFLSRIERVLAVVFCCLLVSGGTMFALSRFVGARPVRAQTVAATVALDVATTTEPAPVVVAPTPAMNTYIEVTDGCGPYFQGECVNVRSGPGTEYADVGSLRSGMVLQVGDTKQVDGRIWYRIVFDESVRYPDRISKEWWVAGDYVRVFSHEGAANFVHGTNASSTKQIVVDLSQQKLFAYEGDTVFMEQAISTGLDSTPTPRGAFKVYRKTPSRYMQGPLPGISDQYYDLPGVPWDLYFTAEGAAIHGAYWHDKFGEHWSHGCVNLPVDKAHELYEWAELGTPVTVRD